MNFSGPEIAFLVFSAITGFSALGVVLSRNLFHSALWLATSFLGVACIYILLNADFVAMSQIIVYVGAVAILVMFAIFLTEDVVGHSGHTLRNAWPAALPVAAAFCAVLLRWFAPYEWTRPKAAEDLGTVSTIGAAFIDKYLFAFELTAIILLTALIGAVFLAKGEKE